MPSTTTPLLVITPAGLAAISAAYTAHTLVTLSSFTVGSGFGYDPTGATGLSGTLLYTGVPNAATINADGSVNVNCVIPGTQGPFTFGEFAVYTSLGVLFGVATLPSLETKYSSLATGVASTFSFDLVFDVGPTAAVTISVTSLVTTSVTQAVAELVSQTAHGLTVGMPIYQSGSAFVGANASTLAGCDQTVGVVSFVIDANTFIYTASGLITGLSGLTPNTQYYVGVTAGTLSSNPIPPVFQHPGLYKPVLVALTATTGIVALAPTRDAFNRVASTENSFYYPLFVRADGTYLPAQYAANLSFNPNTGVLQAPSFSSTGVGVGAGGTWTEELVAGPRVLGGVYTNSTGKTISVCFDLAPTSWTSQQNAQIIINGVQIGQTMGVRSISGGDTSLNMTGTFEVPNSATYSVTLSNGAATINSWYELR